MRLRKFFGSRNFLARSLVAVVLIFTFQYFVTLESSFPSVEFLILTREGEYIQQNFTSIQEAINDAEIGSTIFAPPDIYYERIIINKTVSLIGENASTTVIDGDYEGTIVTVTADNVTITGLTIQNSGWGWVRNGIYVHFANNCEIKNNRLLHNCHNIRLNYSCGSLVMENNIDGTVADYGYGIRFINSANCTAIGNNVSNCIGGVHLQNATECTVERNRLSRNDQGVRLYSPCTYNKIVANIVYDNTYDGVIEAMPPNGTFFNNFVIHNNFINNTNPFIYKVSGNIWDGGYPSGGNHWSRYNGTDLFRGPCQNETGSDGIGDTSYTINVFEVDRYPLIHPYGSICNLNTNLTYLTIQSAIDASETLNEHTIVVDSGIYRENVNINKSLRLIGANKTTTIIDAGNVGTVLTMNADNVSVVGFTVQNSGSSFPPYGDDCGVLLNHSLGCNVSHCMIKNNRIGIYVFYSRSNVIEHNTVSSNLENGILLWYSGNNVLEENEILNNSYNFRAFGGSFLDFNNTIDASNTVDRKPIQYLVGVEDEIFDNETNVGTLYLINCNNVTVRNLNLTKNGHAIFCHNVSSSRIENVTALKNSYGVYLQDSSRNVVHNNWCQRNWVGICLQDSDYNVVEENTAEDCEKGISLYQASYNTLAGNTIVKNDYGIRFFDSHRNGNFHNNLIQNIEQASLISSYQNTWDNGFEGNFWSDYVGSDTNRDGLGDIDQAVDSANRDHYPLFGAFRNFSVSYGRDFYNVTVISNSSILGFVFEDASNAIRLTVNGTDETFGFCRICIPHALVEPEISVIIDDGQTEVLYPNYTLRDDGLYRWIYIAYQHSTHDILIVPEFWPLALLSTLMVTSPWFPLCKRLRMKLKNKRL